jgi:hypothetical protein
VTYKIEKLEFNCKEKIEKVIGLALALLRKVLKEILDLRSLHDD